MVKGDSDGELVECLYFFDIGEKILPVRPLPVLMVRVALIELAVQGKDDRGRIEGGAVMESDIVPKEEGEDGATPGDYPVDGKARSDQGVVSLVGDKPFEDAVGACEGFPVSGVCRVELVRITCTAEDEGGVRLTGEIVCYWWCEQDGLKGECCGERNYGSSSK